MSKDPAFDALATVPNHFLLCVVTFQRAKQLIRGARSRSEVKGATPVMTTLQEISEKRLVPVEGSDTWVLS